MDRLTVFDRSPPVPQVSTARARTSSGMRSGAAWASIAAISPPISAGVSPLARSATANPAIWAGEAAPAMI